MDKTYKVKKADNASLEIQDVQGWRFLSEYFLKDRLQDKFMLDEQGRGHQITRSSFVSIEGILTQYKYVRAGPYFYLQDNSFDSKAGNSSANNKSHAIKVIIPATYYFNGHKFISSLSKNKYILQVKGYVRENLYNVEKKRWEPIPGENGIQYTDPFLSQEGFDQYGHQVYSRTAETTIEPSYIKVLGEVGKAPYCDLSLPEPVDARYVWLADPAQSESNSVKNKNLLENLIKETLSSFDSHWRHEPIEYNRVLLKPSVIIGRPVWSGKYCKKSLSLDVEVIEKYRYEQLKKLGLINDNNGVTLIQNSKVNELLRVSILSVKIESLNKNLMKTIAPGCLINKTLEGFFVRGFLGDMAFEVDTKVNASYFEPMKKVNNVIESQTAQLSIATLNLGNLSGTDFLKLKEIDPERRGKVKKLALQISELGRPDVIACQELGDDDGEKISLNTSSEKTINTFLKLLNDDLDDEDEDEGYEHLVNDEVPPNMSGGKPGLNIRNIFFVKRALFNRIENRQSGVVNSGVDPLVLDDENNPFLQARNPVYLSFNLDGEKFVIVNVHLSSRLGEPIQNGECTDKSVLSTSRGRQLQAVLNFFKEEEFPDQANLIILGDFNTYWYCPEMELLKEAGWINLIEESTISEPNKYTYVHNGLASCLDHVFIGGGLLTQPVGSNSAKVKNSRSDLQFLHSNSYGVKLLSDAGPATDRQGELDMSTVEATDHDPVLVHIFGPKNKQAKSCQSSDNKK